MVFGDDELDGRLELLEVRQTLAVLTARAVVVRRHLKYRLDIGRGSKRDLRRDLARGDELELRCLRQLLVVQIRSVVQHFFETPKMARTGDDRIE